MQERLVVSTCVVGGGFGAVILLGMVGGGGTKGAKAIARLPWAPTALPGWRLATNHDVAPPRSVDCAVIRFVVVLRGAPQTDRRDMDAFVAIAAREVNASGPAPTVEKKPRSCA